jgi:hypothetical protein
MNTTPAQSFVGRTLQILKGNPSYGVAKHEKGKITEVKELGADYGHSVQVTFTVRGRVFVFYARHLNRLSDDEFNMNKGDPCRTIRARVVAL